MENVLIAVCVLLGLALGSFANVVIHRVPRGESIVSPPSACPQCGSPIRPQHNIPVIGWLWLRGRCADCSAPISGRYPAIEAVTAVLFGVIAWATGLSWTLPLLLVLAFFSIVLAAVDLETRRLPDRIVLPFAALAVICIVALAVANGDIGVIVRAAVGAAALGAFYLAAFLAYPRGMGFGDVKLAPVLGALLGSLGWAQLAVGGFSAFVWGSLVGVGVMIAQRRGRGVTIPFGPWMLLGAWTGVIVGAPVGQWYLEVMGLT
ncbi:prepilin peptidase [Demequina muriae]|uniref:Prepilin leader peptidase/N-methyltransferase n=1 Tax=Demequina muriae TaxID=3051664 RepID=A0ABT8GJR5_9MICO|nr:A24 family peptidase [Demequina sp. EGI L300058]MDN4481677.1 prepilin peptidase [Demequina sp. EGI L300058]